MRGPRGLGWGRGGAAGADTEPQSRIDGSCALELGGERGKPGMVAAQQRCGWLHGRAHLPGGERKAHTSETQPTTKPMPPTEHLRALCLAAFPSAATFSLRRHAARPVGLWLTSATDRRT